MNNMMSTLICIPAIFLMLTLTGFSKSLPDDDSSIYIHPELFKDNYCDVARKDVGAFKFFCIQEHISSILHRYRPMLAVSDNSYLTTYSQRSASKITIFVAGVTDKRDVFVAYCMHGFSVTVPIATYSYAALLLEIGL